MEKIRAFIAIPLPADIQEHLRKIEALLKSGTTTPVKWVEPANIHLTLKFLGDTDSEKTGEIAATITEATKGISPFILEVKGLGVFPNPRKAQIAWAGLEGNIAFETDITPGFFYQKDENKEERAISWYRNIRDDIEAVIKSPKMRQKIFYENAQRFIDFE